MTNFPLSMPYLVKAVKHKQDFLRRYNEIFKGEANAAQCFASGKPQKVSKQQYEIHCPFKETPNDMENAPIRFEFEQTKSGWKFVGLDNSMSNSVNAGQLRYRLMLVLALVCAITRVSSNAEESSPPA